MNGAMTHTKNRLTKEKLEQLQTPAKTAYQTSPPSDQAILSPQIATVDADRPAVTLLSSYRTAPPTGTTPHPIGVIEKLKHLVGSASDHSGRMSNLNLDPALPAWVQLPRIVTVFISRNWYWIRWGLIVLLALFVVGVLLPAGLALLA